MDRGLYAQHLQETLILLLDGWLNRRSNRFLWSEGNTSRMDRYFIHSYILYKYMNGRSDEGMDARLGKFLI